MLDRVVSTAVANRTERLLRLATGFVGVVLAVLAGYLALFRLGGEVRTLSYDVPFAIGHRGGGIQDVRIVYIDELDGSFVNRSAQSKLLDLLNEAPHQVRVAKFPSALSPQISYSGASTEPAIDSEITVR